MYQKAIPQAVEPVIGTFQAYKEWLWRKKQETGLGHREALALFPFASRPEQLRGLYFTEFHCVGPEFNDIQSLTMEVAEHLAQRRKSINERLT